MSRGRKNKRACSCGSILLPDGTCRHGCHAFKKPSLRLKQEAIQTRDTTKRAAREAASVGGCFPQRGVRTHR